MLKKYETMLVTTAKLDEEASVALIDKFKALIEANGTMDAIDEWGKRRLAYPINFKTEGYYVLYTFTTENVEFINELERISKINESVLRWLVVRKEA